MDEPRIDPKQAREWLGLGLTLLGWAGAVWAFVVVGFRWLMAAGRGVILSDRLHSRFRDPLQAWDAAQKETRKLALVAHLVAEHARVAYYLADAAGLCTAASPALCELFGCDSTSIHGSGWTKRLDQSEAVAIWEAWRDSVANGVGFRVEYTLVHGRTGERIRVESEAWPVPDTDPPEYVGIVKRKATA